MAHRHKRDTNARRFPRASVLAAPVALLVTAPAVALGVLTSAPPSAPASSDTVAVSVTQTALSLSDLRAARASVSRAGSRLGESSETRGAQYVLSQQTAFSQQQTREATQRAVKQADTRLWTTAPLNLWSAPQDDATRLGVTKTGVKVLVTGRRDLGRVELAVDGKSRWVTAGYLSDDKPEEGVAGIGGTCTNGTTVSGAPNVGAVHEAVCAAFPSITSYGVYRAGSTDHASGHAVDIMVSGDLGWDVANFVRANYAALGVSYVIYAQHIWSLERGGEGWRAMSDRGSVTANHYDHVHVSTF